MDERTAVRMEIDKARFLAMAATKNKTPLNEAYYRGMVKGLQTALTYILRKSGNDE